jgi:hypothetical protein
LAIGHMYQVPMDHIHHPKMGLLLHDELSSLRDHPSS